MFTWTLHVGMGNPDGRFRFDLTNGAIRYLDDGKNVQGITLLLTLRDECQDKTETEGTLQYPIQV